MINITFHIDWLNNTVETRPDGDKTEELVDTLDLKSNEQQCSCGVQVPPRVQKSLSLLARLSFAISHMSHMMFHDARHTYQHAHEEIYSYLYLNDNMFY